MIKPLEQLVIETKFGKQVASVQVPYQALSHMYTEIRTRPLYCFILEQDLLNFLYIFPLYTVYLPVICVQ